MKAVVAALRRAGGVLVALVLLFEEWGWEPLQRLMARIARLPGLRHLEALIAGLPSWAALIVLLLPSLLLVPVKIGTLWLITQGRPTTGLATLVVAKVVGTAIVARLFLLTRPALMRLPWFAKVYARWVAWKGAVMARVRASWAWRVGRAVKRRVISGLRRWRRRAD